MAKSKDWMWNLIDLKLALKQEDLVTISLRAVLLIFTTQGEFFMKNFDEF